MKRPNGANKTWPASWKIRLGRRSIDELAAAPRGTRANCQVQTISPRRRRHFSRFKLLPVKAAGLSWRRVDSR